MIRRINKISKVKQIFIFIAIIFIAAAFKFSGFYHEYRSPEAVFYACEEGLHYGPSKKILYTKRMENKALVIGRTDDGLSAVQTQKKWYGTWTLLSGGTIDGNLPVDENGAFYDDQFNFLYGLCKDNNIKNVKITLGSYDGIKGITEYGSYDINVNENGFFYSDVEPIKADTEGDYIYPVYIGGFDENGQLVYSYDELEK